MAKVMTLDGIKGKRRPKWAMTKAEGTKFKRMVLALLKKHGARKTTGEWAQMYDLQVPTAAGTLMVSTADIDEGTIFGRFKDVKKGHKCTRRMGNASNQYSGKWNFHFGRADGANAAAYFRGALDGVNACKVRS